MALDVNTIIISAAVGGISAALINFFGNIFDRRSRRKELLLQKAVELGIDRAHFIKEVAKETQGEASIEDSAVMTATYYRWLEHLLNHGELPKDNRG